MKLKEIKSPKKSDFDPADLIERMEIKISDTEEKKLVWHIDNYRSQMELARRQFRDRYLKHLYNWDDFVTFVRKGPWADSSQLHMPLTAIMVKTFVSRLYNIFVHEKTTQLIPRETSDDEFVAMMRRLRHWYLFDYLNNYRGVRGFAREAFTDCATIGFGLGMKDWDVKMRKIIDVEPNELRREMADLGPQVAEAQGPMLQTEEEMATAAVNVKPYKEVEKILTVFEGTRLQTVSFENMFFPNEIPESNDLDFPPLVAVHTEMSLSEIMLNAARGKWDQDRCNELKDKSTMRLAQASDDAAEVREHKSNLSGYDENAEAALINNMRIIEYDFVRYDIDDDGIDEELIVTKSGTTVLKITYLDRISPSGMRPLYKFDCFAKPRQAYARGVPEYMYSLNEEMDQHHNMRIDYLALQTCPFGVYRGSSSLKNQPIQIAPGKFIPVEETTDMRVLNFNSNATALASEEDRNWNYAERLLSISSLAQGIVPDTVGPTRSTSGVNALLREMEKELRITIDHNASQWKKMERMVLDDLDFRIHPSVKMRVLGASAEQAMDQHRIANARNLLQINAQFDMRIDVAQISTSEEIQRADAEMVLNKLLSPSIAHQMGIVRPKAVHRALTDWLTAFGKDPSAFIDKSNLLEKPLTVFQEVQICAQLEVPPMAMEDNHELKANELLAFMKSPEYAEAKSKGIYIPQTDEFIVKAAQKHLSLAQAMEPVGATNPLGQNAQNPNELAASRAPQQGGEDPRKTTSRELPEPPPVEATEPEDVAA